MFRRFVFLCISLGLASPIMAISVVCQGNAMLNISPDFQDIRYSHAIKPQPHTYIIENGHWHVAINQPIQRLIIRDQCQVNSFKWRSRIDELVYQSSKDSVLDGFFEIQDITKSNSGKLMVVWVDSDHLSIRGGNGDTFLAGQTNDLYLDTLGTHHFDGHQLQCQRAHVRSKHFSHNQVKARDYLYLFAQDHSQITYANNNALIQHFALEHASIYPSQ